MGHWTSQHLTYRTIASADVKCWDVQCPMSNSLVPVMWSLVWSLHRNPNVLGLFRRKLREPDAEMFQVEPRHFLVEFLRKHVDLFLVLTPVLLEVDLCQHLVGE